MTVSGNGWKTICHGRITASEGYYGKYEIKAWLSNPPDRRAGMERTWFHYSSIEKELPSIAEVTDAKGNPVSTPLYRYKNLIAGYTHLYWGEMNLMKLWE